MQIYDGDSPLTVNDAKELLGWATPPEGVTKGVFKIGKIRAWMSRNNINRPLYMSQVYRLRQDILKRQYYLNGEPLIIGNYGNVLNGQHTLIALVLAGIELEEHPGKWKDYWQTEPTIDKLCVFGVIEDDKVINTMDTCKVRSQGDVIYRSHYFADLSSSKRRTCARAADYAVRLMWSRTGLSLDAFSVRTTSEATGFLDRHPRLVDAVKFIVDEDVDGSISRRWLSPGYSSAMLYLMGACKSDPKAYRQDSSEQSLDLSMWDDACDYWVALSQGAESVKPMKTSLAKMQEPTWRERTALIAKGWMCMVMGRKLSAKELKLVYTEPEGEEGFSKLAEMPTVGGIDQGDPDPEDKEEGATKSTKTKSSPKKPKQANPNQWAKGDAGWIKDEDEWFFGTLTEDPLESEHGVTVRVADENGDEWDVPIETVYLSQSEAA